MNAPSKLIVAVLSQSFFLSYFALSLRRRAAANLSQRHHPRSRAHCAAIRQRGEKVSGELRRAKKAKAK